MKKSILTDIKYFQRYVEEDFFVTVARLMLKKWLDNHGDIAVSFSKYFSRQWLSPKRMGWFDHYADWTP